MQQGVISIQCEKEGKGQKTTARGGLLPYLDLMAKLGFWRKADQFVGARSNGQGWSDGQHVAAMVMLNLAGGSCVDDLAMLEGDSGLGELIKAAEVFGMSRKERRAFQKRQRKGRNRSFSSPSASRRFLEDCHNDNYEKGREAALEQGVKAYIPAATAALSGLMALNAALVKQMLLWNPLSSATLDMDATLIATQKKEALFCYKHFPAYQPLNVWLAEREIMLWSEFRDGNVPAGYEQLRVFKDALSQLPASVGSVQLRSDSAGYQWDLLKYCAEGQNSRFGVIEFAVSADVTKDFRQAVKETPRDAWRPLYRTVNGEKVKTDQEWAEICFVPNELGKKKNGPEYRYLAIREPLKQLELPGMEEKQMSFPFPTMSFEGITHKLFGVITNRAVPGDEVIWWLRERCGKSEEAHSILKSDLAGGTMPSALFGANAAWWQVALISFNINSAMKHFVLDGVWSSCRLKALRFGIINVVGRIFHHARTVTMTIAGSSRTTDMLIEARRTILALAPASG
jgi:hypothetical protein